MATRLWAGLVAGAAVLGLALTGCGGSSSTAPSAPPSVVAPPSAGPPAPGAASSAPPATSAPAQKVSANTADKDQIAAALKAAGVPNSSRWADEVVEYRPYPADDPNLSKLRQSLAKYNPGQDTIDKIVSALRP